MNSRTFLSNFSHVVNAPDGVKSLRQLVMASALAGKFSAPNEDLPLDIQARLEKARSLHFRLSGKREKSLLFAGPLIHEFEIPLGWQWVRVGQICDLQTGATPSTQRPEYWGGEIPWLASGDVNRREIFECDGRITESGLANSNCKILPENSVLIALNGQGKTRATVALLRIPAACNQSLVAMIPFDVRIVTPEYLFLSLRYRYHEIREITGQEQRRGLNMGLVSDLSVPLAPFAEQKRIVAKVDELMALCDQLEALHQEREQRFYVLSRTCHARFGEKPTTANLNRIFGETGIVSPDDLRRTILALAVQGKLVPQDPKDEPADHGLRICGVDLKRWAVAKDEERQDVPHSWTWIKFAGVGEQRLGKMLDAGKNRGESKPYLRNTNVQWMRFELDDVKEMRVEEREEKDLRLKRGDLLICEGGEPGRCAIWRNDAREMYFQKALHRVRPCDAILSEFLALNLQIDCRNGVLAGYFTGATIKHLTGRSLSAYPIPIPPLAEQRRIVAKVDELMTLVGLLEAQQQERDRLAEAFVKACVASFTGTTQLERPEKMKAPKTELVSIVTSGKKIKPDAKALLANLLSQNKGTLPAKYLWQQSGLTIDAFYQQLKTEIAQGWVATPAEAKMKVIEEA